jgi:hypothetical protein
VARDVLKYCSVFIFKVMKHLFLDCLTLENESTTNLQNARHPSPNNTSSTLPKTLKYSQYYISTND